MDLVTKSWLPDFDSTGIMIILIMYFAFVLLIGPAHMKNRPPYKLTAVLLVYNFVQVVLSAYLAIISLKEMLQFEFLPRKCYMAIEEHFDLYFLTMLLGKFSHTTHLFNAMNRHLWTAMCQVNHGSRLYFIVKITELLDTIFFVLRKKNNQISFLHIYHHSAMAFAWAVMKGHPSHVASFGRFVNSSVHVVMYSYYGLAALGPQVAKYLTWKKYITSLQLAQFVALLLYAAATEFTSECPPAPIHAMFFIGHVSLVLVLFGRFYMKTYVKKDQIRMKDNLLKSNSNSHKISSKLE